MTLTYDLVSRKTASGAYSLYHLRKESQIWCVVCGFLLRWRSDAYHFGHFGHFDLDIDFHYISRFLNLEDISFITNNLHQMCQMLYQFLWGAFVTLMRHFLFYSISFTTGVELPLLLNEYSKRVFVTYRICVTSFFKHALWV